MLPERGLYHTSFAVRDLERAKTELGRALAIEWTSSQAATIQIQAADGEIEDLRLTFCYSLQGPPYIELIQGPPGHPYFAPSDEGKIHHIGLFVDDLNQAVADYEAMGLPREYHNVDADGKLTGFSYHRNPFGASVELVSSETRTMVQAFIRAAGGDA